MSDERDGGDRNARPRRGPTEDRDPAAKATQSIDRRAKILANSHMLIIESLGEVLREREHAGKDPQP